MFKKGIDFKTHLSKLGRRINNLIDDFLGTMVNNLYTNKFIFNIHIKIAYNPTTRALVIF